MQAKNIRFEWVSDWKVNSKTSLLHKTWLNRWNLNQFCWLVKKTCDAKHTRTDADGNRTDKGVTFWKSSRSTRTSLIFQHTNLQTDGLLSPIRGNAPFQPIYDIHQFHGLCRPGSQFLAGFAKFWRISRKRAAVEWALVFTVFFRPTKRSTLATHGVAQLHIRWNPWI